MFNKNGLGKTALYVMLTMFLGLFVLIAAVPQSAFAATTELTITKYANDGKTVLDQVTVDYHWLKNPDNITVMGDGVTHYYHQGPVFIDEPADAPDKLERLRWNEEEDQNWDTKDMGAVKGTNVVDLCELVGGMSEGDTLKIKASDGFTKTFAYKNVYNYSEREGPMVVCWYKDGKYPDTGYSDGMRLVWFAKDTYKKGPTSIENLPSGYYHVFGNWDWHEAADREYWYYYNNQYPTTTGLSVQKISQLNIYSNEPVPNAAPDLIADTEDNKVGQAVEITFTDDATWRSAITSITVEGTALTSEQYSISPGIISINADVFTAAGDYEVVVEADGYSSATVTQPIVAAPSIPVADFIADKTSGATPLTVQFTDQSTGNPTAWEWDFNNDGTVDSTQQNPIYEYTAAGKYTVKLNVTNDQGSDEIVKADYITVIAAGPHTWSVDDSGNADFASIQAAVTAANAGDTIMVKDGTYTENITVDKSLTIKSENGAAQTIVQAANTAADVFMVTAENVTIEGFTVSGATGIGKSGICLSKVSGQPSGSCTVKNNLCTGNSQGISIASSNNTIDNNNCSQSGRYGIYLSNTTGNTVTDNVLTNNTAGSGYALYLADNADNNTVSGNTIDSNLMGIRIKAADANTLYNNIISNNTIGLELATKPVNNRLYQNNFIDNTTQLSEGYNGNTENFWNSSSEISYTYKGTQYSSQVGNYWCDYAGTDSDGNGIGESPYATIASYKDNYPLMGAWQNGVITAPAIAPVAAFTADKTSGSAPLTVQFTDQSTNEPTSWAWDFNNDGTIDSTEQNPTFIFNTPGTYTVKLTVTNSAGSDDETKTDYITVSEPVAIDVLYDGSVTLTPDKTFTVTVGTNEYTIDDNTPLGALHKAAIISGFTYDVTDKNYSTSGALLLDNIADYDYVKKGSAWYAYVNGALKDGYNNPDGALNLIQLADGDKVEFYYADVEDGTDFNAVKAAATAAVKTVVVNGVVPTDWTLQLSGARNENVTKAYFEQGLACPLSGHQVTWTDEDGNVWGGIPLWLLVAMVDDDPDEGDYHFNFNDELADEGYEVKVIAGDGWSTVLDSADIAGSDAYIVANTLNGEPLPLKIGDKNKDCWPLYLKGSAISGGQQVGNIVRIELSGLPEPPAGWTLDMIGEIGDTITQEEFEEGLACTSSGHYQEWTDNEGKVWSGIPLWVLLGTVDDVEQGGHWTFNETLADSYTVKVVAGDGFSKTFDGADVANSNDYIVANKCDGEPLTGSSAPLRLVGDGVTKDDGSLGGMAVGNIARIEIPELQTPPAGDGSWNLTLDGRISDVISQAEFEAGLACPYSGHLEEWTDADGNLWSGIPLWYLAGWVDDRKPHNYDFNQAVAGYKVVVKAGDGYSVDFDSEDINESSDYIVANKCNGAALTDSWPLRLVGDGVANEGALTGRSVGNIVEIKLTSFESGDTGTIPELRIVKYGEDGTTIIDEETLTYLDMMQFDVIGDGETVYKFQGNTFDPDDIWDENETGKGGYKIANAVKGTRISDLCSLVGGMGTGTEIVLAANDGYEVRLPYSSIYPDPSVYARQGDAILAWYADGKYVPDYKDGMRLFFTPEDTVYSQMDMRLTLPEPYWHFYYSDVMYPSCAGLSNRNITTIEVYSVPQGDWTLELDGQDIGGLKIDISKTYFESALSCTMGANHKTSYTDSENRVWEGMPLWFLAGFVDDADQHSDNAFNNDLANSGYQVVITAGDGTSVTIDSKDIIRNKNYIIANTLDGATIPKTDDNWPLKLVGPNVSSEDSIANIVSIKLVSSPGDKPVYNVSPVADSIYTTGTTSDGINTMTVNSGVSGFKYFTVNIEPEIAHSGEETVVFTHLRNGSQLQINSTRADFDQVGTAQAGFNVQAGDVVKVYIVDELTNAEDRNPVILQ